MPGIEEKLNYVELPQPNTLLTIQHLDYKNPYDYSKMHRHDYFEVMFIKQGGGSQIIDFNTYQLQANDIYIIYPGQMHLMDRRDANGLVIQFRKNIFEYIHAIKHYHLYHTNALVNSDISAFDHLFDITARMQALLQQTNQLSPIALHKAYSYLQIVLLSVVELNEKAQVNATGQPLLSEYISLITHHINTKKKVAEYALLLGCTPEKLNDTCKKALGKTALQLIHEELLLEIRRLLLLNELSLKEISFQLNFDSQSNFSTFIKTHTSLTPKELQAAVLEIYN